MPRLYTYCVTTGGDFYKTASNGVKLVDFVKDVLAGKPTQVDCEPRCGILAPEPQRQPRAQAEAGAEQGGAPDPALFWWRK